jgi:hypothetical protein
VILGSLRGHTARLRSTHLTDQMDPGRIFDDLFVRARQADEFEYACALLRVRGMEDFGWDPLEETAALFNDIGTLLSRRRFLLSRRRLHDYARVRLGLLLYSHLTEVDAIYEILVNMIEITAGDRYTMDPLHDLYRPPGRPRYEQYPPSAKKVVERLKEKATAGGFDELVALIDWFFNDAVRNAFFHSDYVLHQDEFRSREATFVDSDGVRSASMKIVEIVELINRSMVLYQAFIDVYEKHRRDYDEDKQVRGRIGAAGSEQDVTLLASEERGLYGFRG